KTPSADFKKVNIRLCRHVDLGRDLIRVGFDFRPVAASEDEDADFPPVQILLVQQVLVGRHEQFKTGCFRERQQLAVFLLRPAQFKRTAHLVFGQMRLQWFGNTLVKKNFHAGVAVRISSATANCSRVTPSYQSRNSACVPPWSRWSKKVCTGTRVPLKTSVPLITCEC